MVVEIDMFSGRPNPRWRLSEAETDRLTGLLRTLEPADGPPPSPPGLGYRGFRLRDSNGSIWAAYRGFVQSPGGLLADSDRRVERFLLDHLPAEYDELRSSLEI
jgi:hypothetical protein